MSAEGEEPVTQPDQATVGGPVGGVFLGRWHSLRIPAGAIVLRLGTDGLQPDPVRLELLVEMWPHWLEIAFGHARAARDSHVRLLAAHDARDGDAVDQALRDELRGSMQAICSAAFAIDALYGSIAARFPVSPSPKKARSNGRTSRSAIVLEEFNRVSVLQNPQVVSMKRQIRALFRFRGSAVHPPGDFREPILHPELNVGVDERFFRFRSDNAYGATLGALEVILRVLEQPRDLAGHREWCAGQRRILDDVLTAEKITYSWNPTPGEV